jgi:hypothetical protein
MSENSTEIIKLVGSRDWLERSQGFITGKIKIPGNPTCRLI